MEAALKNILEISNDRFAQSQAKWGLGIEEESKVSKLKYWIDKNKIAGE